MKITITTGSRQHRAFRGDGVPHSADDGRRHVEIAINWGRYGELFGHDADDGELVREPEARILLQQAAKAR